MAEPKLRSVTEADAEGFTAHLFGDLSRSMRDVDFNHALKPNGAMAANEYYGGYWLNSNGTWSYKHQAKWLRNSKGWYYTDDTGWYAKSGTYKIDGKDYAFNDSGYWIE